MGYHPIESYGVIGDLRTAALVGAHGSVDWLCLPRFDSQSLFAAILDQAKGGRWSIAPTVPHTSEQHYLPGTNVLATVFHAGAGGVLELVDFMPMGRSRTKRPRLIRWLRAVRGEVPARLVWAPRFDYGMRAPRLERRTNGVLATDQDNDAAGLSGPKWVPWALDGQEAVADLALHEGAEAWFVMTWDDDEVTPLGVHEPMRALDDTLRWWDAWLAGLHYSGPYRREVERSALALKLCCHDATGAIVAAPTTSLPESHTGGRTWDYRFAWLRDSAFVLYALEVMGFERESEAFMRFLKRVGRREDGRHLQIMYGVDAERDLPERVLDHLEGWRGMGPVRIGNGAVDQFQLDVYGEVLATAAVWGRRHRLSEGMWRTLRGMVEWVVTHWQEPDYSIWEPRLAPRHHVFSKVMAWVALDRGVQLAEHLGHTDEATRWRAVAEAVHQEVLERGWDPARGTFLQAYGEPQLDAALLVVPAVRFLPREDARVRTTLEAIRRELASPCEDLIYRYRGPDGLGGDEGAFLFTSFWMVQTLAMVGEFDEAERLFRHLLRRASPVGLFAEEVDPSTGEHLGNYPQALSHAAMLTTAYVLERLRPDPD
jgi:GH15 family glucan-1,4-alpha-glucosidase